MSEVYTPTTDEVRDSSAYGLLVANPGEGSVRLAKFAFDRWLAEHDAEVIETASGRLVEMMAGFPMGGRHTRAGWAVAMLEALATAKRNAGRRIHG